MNDDIRRLPDSELEVMQALWDCEVPAQRKDIEAVLYKKHPMAVTTLLTLLNRLSEKNFIRIDRVGRGSVYTPLIERSEYLSSQSKRFYHKLCGGSMAAFASALCDSGISREEIEELRRLLEENSL